MSLPCARTMAAEGRSAAAAQVAAVAPVVAPPIMGVSTRWKTSADFSESGWVSLEVLEPLLSLLPTAPSPSTFFVSWLLENLGRGDTQKFQAARLAATARCSLHVGA